MIFCIGIFIVVYLAFDWLRRLPKVSGLHKKCVVITGCDTGFGNALAKSLYRKGVYVFAGCYTEDGAEKLAEETGERLKIFRLDVTKTESIEKAYEFVKNNLPPDTVVWGLVNNAGIMSYQLPIEFIPKENMYNVMNVNCFGMVEMDRKFLPLLKKSRGRIVHLASMASKLAVVHGQGYNASKYAILGVSESLRREKAIWGIKVSAICPGFYRTGIVDVDAFVKRSHECWNGQNAEIREEYGQEFFDQCVNELSTLNKNAPPDLSPVINDIEHALFALWPYNIYHSGMEAKILAFIVDYLPTFVMDKVLSTYIAEKKPKALQ